MDTDDRLSIKHSFRSHQPSIARFEGDDESRETEKPPSSASTFHDKTHAGIAGAMSTHEYMASCSHCNRRSRMASARCCTVYTCSSAMVCRNTASSARRCSCCSCVCACRTSSFVRANYSEHTHTRVSPSTYPRPPDQCRSQHNNNNKKE